METMNDIEEYLSEQATASKQAITECKNNIEQAEQTTQKANQDLATSEKEVNVDVYNQAKNDIWYAQHAKELYSKQLSKLQNTPLITKTEFNTLVQNITESADRAQSELSDQAVPLLKQLKKLADESADINTHANTLLHTLQYDVYKDADKMVGATGFVVTQAKEYNNRETVSNFFNSNISMSYLADRAGLKKKQTIHKSYI